MRVAIILNGVSADKKYFFKEFYPRLKDYFNAEVFETVSKNDGITLTSKAVTKQFDVILAAGGDGTLHQVVNGILQNRETENELPIVGILPLGTGNDFARTINVTSDVNHMIHLLRNKNTQKIDIGKVTFTNDSGFTKTRYFLNVVDVGMGPLVVNEVLNSVKPFGSAVSYYRSILSTFFSYKPVTLQASGDTWQWKDKMRTFAIANGKYYGHGLCIAPDAKLDDGLFDIFACGNASILDFIIQSFNLKKGKKASHAKVQYLQSTAIELSSDKTCAIEADGEFLGKLPAKISILPARLNCLVN